MTVTVLGIRHHGPGSTRSVLAELDRLQPATVLIEGPADADPLLALAADPDTRPPVALLAYAADEPRVSAFWPFAVFSPEWQALLWAARHHVPVRFCDLPAATVLAGREGTDTPDARVRNDPIGMLADAAGYDDAERWWDDVIEARMHGQPPFAALTDAMTELRTAPSSAQPRHEAQREAHMRQVLRGAAKQGGDIAVVCGAWHAPALSGKLPPASADLALLRGMPKRKTTLTWVPWTHSHLAAASGYGAGVTSPGWYHHLFTTPDDTITRWMAKVAGVLRRHDLPVSTAHVIEAVRLADTLATLRGRPLAGLTEVTDATRSVLCDGDETATAFVTRELVVGELLGAVPDAAPTVPLEADLRARARTLRLRIDPLEKALALDLRKDGDRARSVLLHRLGALHIEWGVLTEDPVSGMGTFHETWTLAWRPELAVAIVDAAGWGTTVADAAAARLADTAATARDLATVTAAVEQTLLADLPSALPRVLHALDAHAALDLDVAHLMAAVPALVRAVRYGDVRGTDTSALADVVDALVVRICAGLPAAVTSLGDDAANDLRRRVDEVHLALGLHAQADAGAAARKRWLAALGPVADRRDVHGLLAGRVTRLLLDAGEMARGVAARRFAAHLSVGASAVEKAAWAEGFLSGSGLLLVHDRDLLAVLDGWLAGLSSRTFLDVLPLLRRTFGGYTEPERANIADAISRLADDRPDLPAAAEALDPERAAGVLRTVAAIISGASR